MLYRSRLLIFVIALLLGGLLPIWIAAASTRPTSDQDSSALRQSAPQLPDMQPTSLLRW